jgi:hypothetical protein
MKIVWIAFGCASLAACASSETTSEAAAGNVVTGAAAFASAETVALASEARQVEIESFGDVAVCRRYVATGTRIAGERCEPKNKTAADRFEEDQSRRDFDSMRRQQLYQEQARQNALAEALRRRTNP